MPNLYEQTPDTNIHTPSHDHSRVIILILLYNSNYMKENITCPNCKGQGYKQVKDGRLFFYCPTCQTYKLLKELNGKKIVDNSSNAEHCFETVDNSVDDNKVDS